MKTRSLFDENNGQRPLSPLHPRVLKNNEAEFAAAVRAPLDEMKELTDEEKYFNVNRFD
jgi:hypothetical protein